jgi:NADH-quinone oxidoreductase subunit B
MALEGVLKEGFVTTSLDAVINWTRTGSLWRGNDASWGCPL